MPSATPIPRAHGAVSEHAPHGELEVRDRVAHDGRAALRDQVELGVVEPHGVGEQGARPEHARAVQVGGGAIAVVADAVVDLALGLREVDVDRDVALGADSAIQRSDSSETV